MARPMGETKAMDRIIEHLAKGQDIVTKMQIKTKGTRRESDVWNEIYDALHGVIARIERTK